MKILFWMPAVLAILYEMAVMQNPTRFVTMTKDIKEDAKNKSKSIRHGQFAIMMLLYMIWGAVGLFSSQWVLFILLWVLSFIPKMGSTLITRIDAVLSLGLIGFMIINSFHLHIDILELIKNQI